MRLYFDSCTAIYLVERREPWHTRIRAQFDRLQASISEVIFSDLNRLECRVVPLALNRSDVLADYDEYFSSPGMVWFPLQPKVFDLATELRARHRLKTPDALHLAAAIQSGCHQLWTNDLRLTQAAAGHIEIVAFTEPSS
jgi:predicted nucleic acid-binding protein